MTPTEFQQRLSARARMAGLEIPSEALGKLDRYFSLLSQWNLKVNLTALPLQNPTEETLDRLLIEPLVAAGHVADSAKRWLDIGSGGGSPAIPMKILHLGLGLTMVESRERKAAFLKEAVRTLELAGTVVENDRFENVADRIGPHTLDLVTVRAVKGDEGLFDLIYGLLSPKGSAFFFHSGGVSPRVPPTFRLAKEISLGTGHGAKLSILEPMFHVEQRR